MKKGKLIAAAGMIYFVAALGIYCTRMNSNSTVNRVEQGSPEPTSGADLPENQPAPAEIRSDILSQHSLPSLERMDQEDQEQYIQPLQVIRKIEELGLDTNDMLCPEIAIAEIEERVGKLDEYFIQSEKVVFDKKTSQELQQVIDENPGVVIDIVSEQIEVTDPIVLHGNTVINGNGAGLHTEGVEYVFYAEGADNIKISDIFINGGTEYGIYLAGCDHIKLTGNTIKGCGQKAISITGVSDGVIIRGNTICDNQSGAVYIAGSVTNGLIESNMIKNNHGNDSLASGIVMTDTMQPEYPHDLIIRDNKIEDNDAAGIYSDGAYMGYVLNNTVCGNQKEGINLCHGTVGFYLSRNTIRLNGGRVNNTDTGLCAEHKFDTDQMEDGSAKANMPGILLDNAAYNILENNSLTGNQGGGINMLHSAVRNVIMGNVIRDNNAGQDGAFRFYGIALKAEPSGTEGQGADYTADYENIICRNIISGSHYSGIFIDEGCYINDVFDNIVMDAQVCGIEAVSLKFNSIINNTTNCGIANAFQ